MALCPFKHNDYTVLIEQKISTKVFRVPDKKLSTESTPTPLSSPTVSVTEQCLKAGFYHFTVTQLQFRHHMPMSPL